MKTEFYEAPAVEVIEVALEAGFAQSGQDIQDSPIESW